MAALDAGAARQGQSSCARQCLDIDGALRRVRATFRVTCCEGDKDVYKWVRSLMRDCVVVDVDRMSRTTAQGLGYSLPWTTRRAHDGTNRGEAGVDASRVSVWAES